MKHFANTYAVLFDKASGAQSVPRLKRLAAMPLRRWKGRERSMFFAQFGADRRALLAAYKQLGADKLFSADSYVVEKALTLTEELRESCPTDLPADAYGEGMGMPRIYHVAALMSAGQLHETAITQMLEAYQSISPLTMRELWILPDMLRVALLKRIRILLEKVLHKREAHTCQAVQGCISNLRYLELWDAETAFESYAVVEHILSRDEVYAAMDAPSRAFYRGRVTQLAKKLHIAETVVAENALYLCEGRQDYQAHVGYYLIDEGEYELKSQLRPDRKHASLNNACKLRLFIMAQALIAAAILFLCWENPWSLLLFSAAWGIANALALRIFMRFSRRRFLPRLRVENAEEVLVAIPALLAGKGNLENAILQMESHYLANPLPGACFAVLGDFRDSDKEEANEKEQELLRAAERETQRLNEKYASKTPRFFFLIRKRSCHEPDGIFMGRERKRGALEDLMRLLAEGESDAFLLCTSKLPAMEYVLTLDEDTILPRESLQSFVGAVRHPLNRPVYAADGRVERGYGVIFPVMRNTASGAAQSAFARLAAGDPGVESYRACISEFYMDMFGSGIFGGKGIWRIQSYLDISREIPANAVLCHDLLEGSMARAGMMEDISLYDAEPASCLAWWKRMHRWIRGDWQLLPFLRQASSLARYQMLENLRRSLLPVTSLVMLFALPFMGGRFAAAALLFLFAGPIFDLLHILFARRSDRRGLFTEREPLLRRSLLELMLLPFAAWRSLDAVLRTLYRLFISHAHMLEWQTAAQQSGASMQKLGAYWRVYAACPLAAVLLLVLSRGAWSSLPFALLWLFAPLCIYGLDMKPKPPVPSQAQRALLMEIALRTWQFFETYANEKTGYLPPDNVQESPQKPPVMRTSPTNIGMAAVSVVAAHDLGFIDTATLRLRLSKMADTLEKLDTWHGHLYNWYDLSDMRPCTPAYVSSVDSGNFVCAMLACAEAAAGAKQETLAQRLRALALRSDFRSLYDEKARLFHIGYDCQSGALSPSHYDLLASEARLLSFIAVALGQIEQRHWFSLGRLLTRERVLVSWSGTMFEYLMPVIFTGMVRETLLYRSCIGAVQVQISAANKSGIWGVSESAYYAFDRRMYYQYAPFGIRALALCDKEQEDVCAPYATLLALMCASAPAMKNLLRLQKLGVFGEYGMYEAVDFEEARSGGEAKLIKSYMAHHQGMGLCAIADILCEGSVRRRFMQVPQVRAARLLLEEKTPLSVPIKPLRRNEKRETIKELAPREGKQAAFPETQLLTNGHYTCFLSEWGGGFSRCGEVMLSRWRPSLETDAPQSGLRAYVATQDEVWEICGRGEGAKSWFLPHEVCFERTQSELSARMRVCVSAQHDGEIREIRITNRAKEIRAFSLGIFFEPCLATQAQDMAHPAFQKLRIDAASEENVLLFWRRRAPDEKPVCLYCLLDGVKARYCTDCLIMPGRGRSEKNAMLEPMPDAPLSSPIEPGCYIRAEFTLGAGDAQECRLVLGCARDRETAIREALALREEDPWEYARARARSNLYFARIERGKADLFERLAGRLLMRAAIKERLPKAEGGVKALWAMGISGDLPILLLRCAAHSHLRTARLLASFEAYFAARGEGCDVVLLGEYPRAYRNELREELEKLRAPHVHLLHAYERSPEEIALLQALCMVEMDEQTLDMRLEQSGKKAVEGAPLVSARRDDFALQRPRGISEDRGFDPVDGSYVILLPAGAQTPLPWCNILCNENFGTLVSERGGGYTWMENSRLNKLTPWHNDPVTDKENEKIRMTDTETGESWEPFRDSAPLCVRHGFGYSSYRSGARAIHMQAQIFIDPRQALKYTRLEIENPLMRRRMLQIEYTVDWRLGDLPHNEAISAEYADGVLRVCNMRNGQRAYMALCPGMGAQAEYGIARGKSSLSFSLMLSAGEKREILLLLGGGEAPSPLPGLSEAEGAYRRVEAEWEDRLGVLRVKTTDAAMDIMLNGWLPYQTICGRLLGRTGYYQCGGAIGFRDQLQDTIALKLIAPERLRAQLLLCASKQFAAGDVLHWWHPGENAVMGVRTHIQDDRLFLPYALLEYLDVTGDMEILREEIDYLEDVPIAADKKDVYGEMYASGLQESLYAHCRKAIESIETGAHGLCLMGGGDWNDAMDMVGQNGGESVWLSFFLVHVLERFAALAAQKGDSAYACSCKEKAAALRAACENEWDGAWYRRACFGDGTPLGTKDGKSCAIDCITQAWAAICGASHAEEAFDSMLGMLLDEEAGILKLLAPPFSPEDEHEAGYIQAYLPGVRENGGQYTHGACWAVMGACALGRNAQAEKLFKMLLPTTHTATAQGQQRYKGEPYVAAGDIYALEHAGRAGWTWYTGAAGWLYTLGVEHILGIRREKDVLLVRPATSMESFSFRYRFGKSLYEVHVNDVKKRGKIALIDDGKTHRCTLG